MPKLTRVLPWAGASVAALLLALTLPGCGMSSVTSGLGSGIFGGPSSTASADAAVNEEQLLAAAKSSDGSATASIAGDTLPGCPKFVVWPRDNAITVFEPGRVGDALAVSHRGEITKTARECSVSGNQVTVKYGFSGRVLLGPRGKTGAVSLPVSVFVTDAKREKIATDKMNVDTIVALENPIGYFSAVRTVTFPIPEGSRAGEFELFVGFERNVPNSG